MIVWYWCYCCLGLGVGIAATANVFSSGVVASDGTQFAASFWTVMEACGCRLRNDNLFALLVATAGVVEIYHALGVVSWLVLSTVDLYLPWACTVVHIVVLLL